METKEMTINGSNESAAVMTMIERVAINPDIGIEKLEKMLDMQERILDRNAKQSWASSFARMQKDMPMITENGEIKHNGKLISKYALWEDVNEAIRPVLCQYGFGLSFRIKQDNSHIIVTAILSHEEGHSEETCITLPADGSGSKNGVQSIGSSVSYGKRYTGCAILNISTGGEDNDGNEYITTEQAADLDTRLRKANCLKSFLTRYGIENVTFLPSGKYAEAIQLLKQKEVKK